MPVGIFLTWFWLCYVWYYVWYLGGAQMVTLTEAGGDPGPPL